jgi:tRNA(Ile)-lysidine synthase
MHPTNSNTLLLKESPRFLGQLADAIESLGLRGASLLVGVSGGADSVSLLRGLRELADPAELRIVVAHLNHGMRPAAAGADADWTQELCGRLGTPIVIESVDVPAYANHQRLGLEEAARTLRYQFFGRAARREDCTHVAVAHTADDQVETVLHHLFRGTGLAGLRGMLPRRPLSDELTLVRPLLAIRRVEIEAWLAEIGQDFRIDVTNADQSRTRSCIRHTVLPALERELGPQVRDSLLRLADQASDLQSVIEELAANALHECLEDETREMVRLNANALAGRPRHLIREVFVKLWKRRNWPRQAMDLDAWDRLAALVDEEGRATLPGRIEALRRGILIVVRRQ